MQNNFENARSREAFAKVKGSLRNLRDLVRFSIWGNVGRILHTEGTACARYNSLETAWTLHNLAMIGSYIRGRY